MKESISTNSSLPSIKPSHSTFLTSSTDDMSFAKNQVEKINRRMMLQNYNSLKPWEKSSMSTLNSVDELGKSNHSILKELKKKVKINFDKNKRSLKDLDWNSQKYISNEQLVKIFDASSIVKKMTGNQHKEPYIDLYTYSIQSKDLCTKNMIIDLIKDERKKISIKENQISLALKKELKNIDKDIDIFEDFKDKMNMKCKKTEEILQEIALENKKLNDFKKKYSLEYKTLLDDTEKILRNINIMKYYASFVNDLLGGERNKKKDNYRKYHSILIDDVLIGKNKEKEITDYSQIIFHELGYLCENDDNDNIENYVLSDPSKINNLFDSLELDITRALIKNSDIEKEIIQKGIENSKILADLESKLENHQNDYDRLKEEINKINGKIKEMKSGNENSEYYSLCRTFVREIYGELFGTSTKFLPKLNIRKSADSIKSINNKLYSENLDSDNYIIEDLHKITKKLVIMQNKIDYHVDNLQTLDGDPLLIECIENKKKLNKLNKNLQERKLIQDLEIEKINKLVQKMNRFVIKGRGREYFPKPFYMKNISCEKKEVESEDDSEMEMIKYS